MKIHEVEQGSYEWHVLRRDYLTGSHADEIIKYHPGKAIERQYALPLAEAYDGEEGYQSAAMQRGKELEPEARAVFTQKTGIHLDEVGFVSHDSLPIGISPDGLTMDNLTGFEVKCPGAVQYQKMVLADTILPEYTGQIAHQFAVIEDLKQCFWVAYRPEFTACPMLIYRVRRDTPLNFGTEAEPVPMKVAEAVKLIHTNAPKIKEAAEALNVLAKDRHEYVNMLIETIKTK